jgi:hypothetical protein
MQIRAVHGHDIAVGLRRGSRRHAGLGRPINQLKTNNNFSSLTPSPRRGIN